MRRTTTRSAAGRVDPSTATACWSASPWSGTDVERLDLGLARSAHRAIVTASGWGARAHRRSPTCITWSTARPQRDDQARQLLAWLEAAPLADAQVVVGDFNAEPAEPTWRRMTDAGFASAYAVANGAEPAVTWPSGLQAPAMDTDGDPGCLDYIWVRGAVAVVDARLVFDRPHPEDPTLYPSDHLGLGAHLEIG